MALQDALTDITNRLRQGAFPNEQSVSQGIVLRVFQELGWNSFDPTLVWPEYQTGEGRADFALCHPPSKPAIFIEVKQPGKAEDAVRQALGYAFHSGVPFVVLTDGRTWSFYLPAEQGSYEDRRVYKLDLYERSTSEASGALVRYLDCCRVQSGDSLETARDEYRNRNRQAQAKEEIPEAWRELVEKGDEALVEILTNAVESRAGIRPDEDDVAEFLEELGKPIIVENFQPSPLKPKPERAVPAQKPQRENRVARRGELVLLGQVHQYANAKDAMVIILRKLAERDPNFLERCSLHPSAEGRKRRYIARTTEALYPDREDLREMREELPGGWFVATNLNNVLKRTIIRLAAEISGLEYGKDIVVEI